MSFYYYVRDVREKEDELPMPTIARKQNNIHTLATSEELEARQLLWMQIARIENEANAE